MNFSTYSLAEIQQRIDEVNRFLSVTLSIANAHTVEFYTHDVWKRFMAVSPEEVLSAVNSDLDQQREPKLNETDNSRTMFGFCIDSKQLVDIHKLLLAAKAHSLSGLGVCVSRDELLKDLRGNKSQSAETGAELEADEFMNSKKSHEVQCMSEVVACLAQHCGVKQVIDVGSGKGYLSSFLSLQYGLQVFGIDSSSTNTHGAQERNRKLKKFSRAYQKHTKATRTQTEAAHSRQEEKVKIKPEPNEDKDALCDRLAGSGSQEEEKVSISSLHIDPAVETQSELISETGEPFFSVLSADVMDSSPPRVPPSQLSSEEKERRKRENLERKAQSRKDGTSGVFSPLTSFVTAQTELRELISELKDAVMVGLHTCGDLAPSTLKMFVDKPELAAVCGVGCCYHLLSEEFDPSGHECLQTACGFPLSRYLRHQSCFCGRNARMSACLALERVSVGRGIQMESLFFRAVLHVILRDHYSSYKSEKRVGNVYSKTKSFVDYVRRALHRLELDDSKLSDGEIQSYHDTYRARMQEMHAFNMKNDRPVGNPMAVQRQRKTSLVVTNYVVSQNTNLKVTLAPCIEGLILLDRLCYLKEQDGVSSALVQLFNPLLSPRCYALIGVKSHANATS